LAYVGKVRSQFLSLHGEAHAEILPTHARDDAALPSGPCILSLSRLQQDEAVRNAPHLRLGVALPVDQPAEVLAPYLDRLSLVAVNFPTFRDGRGFTQARSLREHLAFSGEIRATGNILPDQYVFLLRCGITTVEIKDGADPAAWQNAADRFSFTYQPSVLEEPVLSGRAPAARSGR
jgi:uncharacterized protein (DUF934 family)